MSILCPFQFNNSNNIIKYRQEYNMFVVDSNGTVTTTFTRFHGNCDESKRRFLLLHGGAIETPAMDT